MKRRDEDFCLPDDDAVGRTRHSTTPVSDLLTSELPLRA